MKLQPASKRELGRISVGVVVGSALMLGVFAALGKFTWQALWGALLGAAVAIGNFFYLAVSVQKAAAAEADRARMIMRASYTTRMLITLVALVLGVALKKVFYWLAVLIPILLPRVTILVLQITGVYRPNRDAPADNKKSTEKEE